LTETTRALTENCAQFVHKPLVCDGGLDQLIGSRLLGLLATFSCIFSGPGAQAQNRGSLAGEEAAQALKRSVAAEDYNIKVGPVRFQAEGRLALGYTDNVFFSGSNKKNDFLINPEVDVRALWPITELNTLRFSLGLGYEWYLKNTVLNSDAPLINPDSELAFNIFAGDFRIRLHEKFSYQESLFFSSLAGGTERLFNFQDVGKFSRWDNLAGLNVDWDLNKVVLSVGYDHENFIPVTTRFRYLDRASEWFTSTAAFRIGDKAQTGLEAQASLHDYKQETVLNGNWRARVGPFLELKPQEKISLRAGGGFDMARFDSAAADNSDFDSYYWYVSVRQDTRLFTHSLMTAREHLLGDNANNLRTTYVRYSITSPIFNYVEVGGNLSVNFAEEFGGPFREVFTYYRAGLRIGYQFHKYWRTDLGYDFYWKESDLPLRDLTRNRLTWDLAFNF